VFWKQKKAIKNPNSLEVNMTRLKKASDQPKKLRAPAKSLEARENQLIALAVDLAEKQLSEGTASSQVITHYLKLGSTTERLEKEKIMKENELLKAKVDALKDMKKSEELYQKAIEAFSVYNGQPSNSPSRDD
jgi:hypothetical protein